MIWAVIIFAGSSISHPPVPSLPGVAVDKIAHTCEYAVLGALFCRAFWLQESFRIWAAILAAIVFGTMYGGSDEIHQVFVPGRSCDALDLLADLCGAAIGAVCFVAFASWRNRHAVDHDSAINS